jgi:hypothetical protein
MDDETMIVTACDALLSLSLDVKNIELIGTADSIDMLILALRRYGHSNKTVLTTLSQLIASLSSSSKIHANQFGSMGVCDLLTTALSTYCSSADASEAVCRAVHHMAFQNVVNQNLFGEAGITFSLKKVLQYHSLNLAVSLSSITAVYAVLKDHHNNSAKFAAITTPQIFLDLLNEFVSELEVVKHTLWVLNCVRRNSSNKILVLHPHDNEDEFSHHAMREGEEEAMLNQAVAEIVLALSQSRVSGIVNAIQQHSHDESIAQYGCELVSSVLVWGDRTSGVDCDCSLVAHDGRIYLLNDSHAQLTNYFDVAGTCAVIATILTQHVNNETICASALHAIGLMLRAQASGVVVTVDEQKDIREERMNHFGSLEECETVLKLMHKFSGRNTAILKYSTLVLSNILYACEDEQKLHFIGSVSMIKSIMGLFADDASDQGVARYGCLFISRLSVVADTFPALLLSTGAASFILNALHTHLQVPSVVEHALNALHALCYQETARIELNNASDELGNAEVCQALAAVFTEYPVTSINEPVAFSLCRAVTSLCEENGNNCLRFGKVGACEDIVKQLIHFLNGPYIAIIRDSTAGTGTGTGSGTGHDKGGGDSGDSGNGGGRAAYCELVAYWSCRAIGCLAKDPATWSARSSGGVQGYGGGFNENRVTLGDVGGCEAIAQVMKNYNSDEDMTKWSLWAAMHLCINDEANSGKLLRAGVVKCVKEAKEHFPDNARVQEWGRGVLAQLEPEGKGK